MTAKEKFKIGDRVQLTEYAKTQGIARKHSSGTGVVAGFGREPGLVRIRLDGLTKSGRLREPDSYHCDFWEVSKSNEGKE